MPAPSKAADIAAPITTEPKAAESVPAVTTEPKVVPAAPAPTTTDKSYTVAKGRTVSADRDYGPGDTITLPGDEAKRLQDRGFLVPDKELVIDEGAGPPVVRGTEIKES